MNRNVTLICFFLQLFWTFSWASKWVGTDLSAIIIVIERHGSVLKKTVSIVAWSLPPSLDNLYQYFLTDGTLHIRRNIRFGNCCSQYALLKSYLLNHQAIDAIKVRLWMLLHRLNCLSARKISKLWFVDPLSGESTPIAVMWKEFQCRSVYRLGFTGSQEVRSWLGYDNTVTRANW